MAIHVQDSVGSAEAFAGTTSLCPVLFAFIGGEQAAFAPLPPCILSGPFTAQLPWVSGSTSYLQASGSPL